MLTVWRSTGYGYDKLEVWAIGYPGQESRVPDVAGETRTESIFIDSSEPTESAMAAYSAYAYEIYIIDAVGRNAAYFNVALNSLYIEDSRTLLHYIVLEVLEK
jgi:hypothetical protein